jgi:hypothetical protein
LRTLRSQTLALLAVVLVAFGVERLIVTDAEAIEALGDDVAEALAERRFGDLESLLSEGFHYGGKDRAATIAHVRALVERHKPAGIEIRLYDVAVEGDAATAAGRVAGSVYGRPATLDVHATLVREEDGWKFSEIRGRGMRLP